MMKIRLDLQTGQTIIEVIIALTMIILFLSGIVVVELVAIRNAEYARNKSVATALAKQQLERARVMRDTKGMQVLLNKCKPSCYINENITPIQVTPTGIYVQSLSVDDIIGPTVCPPPKSDPTPTSVPRYQLTAKTSWAQGSTNVTPAPEVEISSCLTGWQ